MLLGTTSRCRPPEEAFALPTAFVMVAVLPEMVLLLIVAASASPSMWMPPDGTPPDGSEPVTVALLPVTRLLLMVKPVRSKEIPPASATLALGADTAARLPLMTLLLIVSAPAPCGP